MKRLISICMLAALILCGVSADAKTSSKKSTAKKSTSAAAASVTAKFADGYPDISGHTYSMVDNGITIKVTFKSNGDANVNLSDKRHSENRAFEWEYFGDGIVELAAVDGSTGMYVFIADNGKKLYYVDEYGDVDYSNPPLKLIK